MSFIVIFAKDLYPDSFCHGTLIGRAAALKDAAALRRMSGDLVMNEETGRIVEDPSWLFPWEDGSTETTSYARRRIEAKAFLPEKALAQIRRIKTFDLPGSLFVC